jgi:hypothetical protein
MAAGVRPSLDRRRPIVTSMTPPGQPRGGATRRGPGARCMVNWWPGPTPGKGVTSLSAAPAPGMCRAAHLLSIREPRPLPGPRHKERWAAWFLVVSLVVTSLAAAHFLRRLL